MNSLFFVNREPNGGSVPHKGTFKVAHANPLLHCTAMSSS